MIFSWKRLLAFLALVGALYAALAQVWSQGAGHWVIDVATVRPAAWLARQICSDASIMADGSHLRSASATLNVLFGCEGCDVLLVLVAAMLVAPVRWRDRLVGVGAGVFVVFSVNQLRLLALFFAMRSHDGWFGPLHGLVAPLAIVGFVSAYFLAWLRSSQRPAHGAARAG